MLSFPSIQIFSILSDFPSEFNPRKRGRPFDIPPYAKSAASASRARSFGFSLSRIFLSLLDHARQQRQKHLRVLLRCGSPSRILSVLRISLGITTRPNSSILRTMPVARTIMLPPSSTFALFGTPIMRQATRFMRMSPSGNPIQRIVQAARPRSMILAEKTLFR